jgi:hypothetical protein
MQKSDDEEAPVQPVEIQIPSAMDLEDGEDLNGGNRVLRLMNLAYEMTEQQLLEVLERFGSVSPCYAL